MATTLTLDQHLDALRAAGQRLAADAAAAGWGAPVPTCPAWEVDHLVAHQGMIHRWAAGNLLGTGGYDTTEDRVLAEVSRGQMLGWFDDGLALLLDAIAQTADDATAMVFLEDAPPPRQFWARRQAHETTIHAVDALAARLRRFPTTAEAGIPPALAVDGVDELLAGFVPRERTRMKVAEPVTVSVEADDVARAWTLDIAPDTTTTTDGASPRADVRITGTAADLYLGLWNRGSAHVTTGRPEFAEEWKRAVRIGWS